MSRARTSGSSGRSANGRYDAASAQAVELVGLKVDVIVAEFTPAAQAAQRATQTIPIVMAPAGDPVAVGLVLDLAHPGGNVTGFSNLSAELAGKRLDILRRLVPGLKTVGLLLHGGDPLDKSFVTETRDAASAIGIATETIIVSGPGALDAALLQMKSAGVRALIVPGNLPVTNKVLANAALRHRLPSVSLFSEYADEGGLVAYGADIARIQRRAGEHVDRILKGARPADIPIEGPTKFELVVNVRTAKALGIQIPPSMLLQADRVIE